MTSANQPAPPIAQPPNESGPDGKTYLDTLFRAGQQSRQIIYFILILIVLSFAAVRNAYSPDWMSQRLTVYQELQTCLDRDKPDVARPECALLRGRMDRNGFRPPNGGTYDVAAYADVFGLTIKGKFGDDSFKAVNAAGMAELKQRIGEFVKRDTDFYTVAIPIIGVTFDVNDLWMVSGVAMGFLLYLLSESLRQEARNLSHIVEHWPGFAEISVMNQTLSYKAVNSGVAYKFFRTLAWLVPTFMYCYIVYSDSQSLKVSAIYIGECRSNLEFCGEIVTLLVLATLNLRCLSRQKELESVIRGRDGDGVGRRRSRE